MAQDYGKATRGMRSLESAAQRDERREASLSDACACRERVSRDD